MNKFFIIGLILFCICGCQESEKQKFQFVVSMINEPEKFDSITKNSRMYNESFRYYTKSREKEIISHLKELKRDEYFVEDCQYSVFRVKDRIHLGYCISI